MNNKKSVAIEVMWLVIAIFSVILGVYKYNTIGSTENSMPFFIITIVSVIMYSLRRYIRKKTSKEK